MTRVELGSRSKSTRLLRPSWSRVFVNFLIFRWNIFRNTKLYTSVCAALVSCAHKYFQFHALGEIEKGIDHRVNICGELIRINCCCFNIQLIARYSYPRYNFGVCMNNAWIRTVIIFYCAKIVIDKYKQKK